MEDWGGCVVDHHGVEFLAAWGAGGGEVQVFEVLTLAFLVGGCAVGAIEFVDDGLAVGVLGVVFWCRCFVFGLFESGS